MNEDMRSLLQAAGYDPDDAQVQSALNQEIVPVKDDMRGVIRFLAGNGFAEHFLEPKVLLDQEGYSYV
jgi:hypothetical protein